MIRYTLYFDGEHMVVMTLKEGRVVHKDTFVSSEEGKQAFSFFVMEKVEAPVILLVDCIAEDFYLSTVPHVRGNDRKALHQRLQRKYFGDSELVSTRIQARQKDERRDDQLLISGVNGSPLLDDWMLVIEQTGIPLQGVVSLPLLGEDALPDLNIMDDLVLLISPQPNATVRHSLYVDGQLKVSRLSSLGTVVEDDVEQISHDIEKTVLFLEGHAGLDNRKTKQLKLHYLDVNGVGETIKQRLSKTPNLSQLIVHPMLMKQADAAIYFTELLASSGTTNHYAQSKHRKHYKQNRLALGLKWAGITMACASVVASILLWHQYFTYQQALPQLAKDTESYLQKYNQRTGELYALKVEASDVQQSVDLVEALQQEFKTQPQDFLLQLSQVLKIFEYVEVKTVDWHFVPKQTNDEFELEDDDRIQRSLPAYRAEVTAALTQYSDDPRQALDYVNRLFNVLRKQPNFQTVTPIKMPFDLSSDAEFTMSNGTEQTQNKAVFRFSVIGRRR